MKKFKLTYLFTLLVLALFFSCQKDEPNTVYIRSVIATPTTSERVILKNNSGADVDLSGWIIGDKNNPNAYTVPNGNTISDGGELSFWASTMGFQINDSGETIYLKNSSGVTVDSWYN